MNFEMQVIRVAQQATKIRGSTISGEMEPCIRMNMGHLLCLDMSRGPTYTKT